MEGAGKCYEREHVQFNSQDLDQEQNVHLDPVQLNTQNIQVILARDDYSCVITGNTYKGKNRYIQQMSTYFFSSAMKGMFPFIKPNQIRTGISELKAYLRAFTALRHSTVNLRWKDT